MGIVTRLPDKIPSNRPGIGRTIAFPPGSAVMANVFLNGYNPFYDETRPTLSDELKHAMAGNTDFSSPDVVASCTRIHNYY
ncbi:MAG: hypothetical protein EOP04_24375, partial [Proteobacteria bacterium]